MSADELVSLDIGKHKNSFFDFLGLFLGDQTLSDVTLEFRGARYASHKVILASCSSFFKEKVMHDPRADTFVLDDDLHSSVGIHLYPEELGALVGYFYTGVLTVPTQRMPEVLYYAQRMGVHSLVSLITEWKRHCQETSTPLMSPSVNVQVLQPTWSEPSSPQKSPTPHTCDECDQYCPMELSPGYYNEDLPLAPTLTAHLRDYEEPPWECCYEEGEPEFLDLSTQRVPYQVELAQDSWTQAEEWHDWEVENDDSGHPNTQDLHLDRPCDFSHGVQEYCCDSEVCDIVDSYHMLDTEGLELVSVATQTEDDGCDAELLAPISDESEGTYVHVGTASVGEPESKDVCAECFGSAGSAMEMYEGDMLPESIGANEFCEDGSIRIGVEQEYDDEIALYNSDEIEPCNRDDCDSQISDTGVCDNPACTLSEHDYQVRSINDHVYPESSIGEHDYPASNIGEHDYPASNIGEHDYPASNIGEHDYPASNIGEDDYQGSNIGEAHYFDEHDCQGHDLCEGYILAGQANENNSQDSNFDVNKYNGSDVDESDCQRSNISEDVTHLSNSCEEVPHGSDIGESDCQTINVYENHCQICNFDENNYEENHSDSSNHQGSSVSGDEIKACAIEGVSQATDADTYAFQENENDSIVLSESAVDLTQGTLQKTKRKMPDTNFKSEYQECSSQEEDNSNEPKRVKLEVKGEDDSDIEYLPDEESCSEKENKPDVSKTGDKDVHTAKPYKCKTCGKAFATRTACKIHQNPCRVKPFQCDLCNRLFSTEQLLATHKLRHQSAHLVICNICGHRVKSLRLREHLRKHAGRSYKCDKCDMAFYQQSTLINHQKIHNVKIFYRCDICPKKYSTKYKLVAHRITHKGGVLICNECGSLMHTKKALREHLQMHMDKLSVQCPKCPRMFRNEHDLKSHSRRHEVHECKECSIQFKQEAYLKRHMMSKHDQATNFQCQYCDKYFFSQELLNTHMLNHSAPKPYQCDDCGACFAAKKSVYNHRRRMHSTGTFICKLCNASLSCGDYLKRHMATHYQEFTCGHCRKVYTSKRNLERHMKKGHCKK